MKIKLLLISLFVCTLFFTGCDYELDVDSSSTTRNVSTESTSNYDAKKETKTEKSAVNVKETESSDIVKTDDLKEIDYGIDYPYPTSELQKGCVQQEVYWLQTALNKALNIGLLVDGDFGNATEMAVKQFKKACNLEDNGVADENTIIALGEVLLGEREIVQEIITPTPTMEIKQSVTHSYILNTNTYKFHKYGCRDVDRMYEENKYYYEGTRDEVIAMGYSPCGHCHP